MGFGSRRSWSQKPTTMPGVGSSGRIQWGPWATQEPGSQSKTEVQGGKKENLVRASYTLVLRKLLANRA